VTNITFTFETSLNTKPKEKNVGRHGLLYTHRLESGVTRGT